MNPDTAAALQRLNRLLPLAARQQGLPAKLRRLHRAILLELIRNGCPPADGESATAFAAEDLQRLAAEDLVVLDETGSGSNSGPALLGAYPLSCRPTPHRIELGQVHLHAMCALDALAVAPLFRRAVVIHSVCHVSGAALAIHMDGEQILAPAGTAPYRVGIRWQCPTGPAAHSLCREMVFLADPQRAREWQASDPGNIELFTLPQAVALGAAFFRPLLPQ